jgi:hypothetical protein
MMADLISGRTDVVCVSMCGLVGEVIGSTPEGKHLCISMCSVHVCITWKEADKGVEILVVYAGFIPQEMLYAVSIAIEDNTENTP